ncbi:MAG TPA: hypothetical protein VH110_02740 [Candidatus Acidoferrum sp.]|nr:hypothetical protein [Candidatus Acidoferrum sp.]
MKLNLIASLLVSVDWLVFLFVAVAWLVIFLLFRNLGSTSRRRRSREIAEKAVKAGDPCRNAERVPVDAVMVEGLPQAELERLTDEFLRLGFTQVLDYRLRLPGHAKLNSFGRALVNRKLFCFAEIMAAQKALETGGSLLCGLDSYLENGWRLGAINRKPSSMDYLQRLPRNLRLMVPDATPAELLQLHLDQRNNLTRDLKVEVLTDLSLDARFNKIAESMALRNEALLNRDIIAEFSDARSIEAEGKWEWLGDYPREVARRMRGKNLRPLMELSPTYSLPQDDALEQMNKAGGKASADEPDE